MFIAEKVRVDIYIGPDCQGCAQEQSILLISRYNISTCEPNIGAHRQVTLS